ncbi:MAG TPA: LamG-like jellyroll fold domain-containing protein, partial [Verrucomicrobiae bacterium]|nr:LamG-like jellyroll fold domain-containing protein [Verrucomicrobiae bacterium]
MPLENHEQRKRAIIIASFVIPALLLAPSPALHAQPAAVPSTVPWPVLSLDGGGGIELPAAMFTNLQSATVEAWVKWADFTGWQRFFSYGTLGRDAYIGCGHDSSDLQFVVRDAARTYQPLNVSGLLVAGEWCHVAAVADPGGMRLYFNGEEVATNQVMNTFAALPPGRGWIGHWTDASSGFKGSVAEFRVWSQARTAEQIRTNMRRQLSGGEPGLAALWNFADASQLGHDASTGRHHGQPFGTTRIEREEIELLSRTAGHALLFGTVTNAQGEPVRDANVFFARGNLDLARTRATSHGAYRLAVPTSDTPGDLWASFGQAMGVQRGLVLRPQERREIDVGLLAPAALSGKAFDPAGKPLSGVKVELIAPGDGAPAKGADPTPEASRRITLTHADGSYHFRRLPPGSYVVRAQTATGLRELNQGRPLLLGAGTNFLGADFQLPPRPALRTWLERPETTNRVLQLDGPGEFARLPDAIVNELDTATLECWVKWDELRPLSSVFVFGFGSTERSVSLQSLMDTSDLAVVFLEGPGTAERAVATGVLRAGEWTHLAVVFDGNEVRLHVNGVLAATMKAGARFSELVSGGHSLGRPRASQAQSFRGQIDEVRVWVTRRAAEQIRADMFTRLTGGEEGLAALWNFDSELQPGRDATEHGFHATLERGAQTAAASPPAPAAVRPPTVLAGTVTDEDGRAVPKANVRLLLANDSPTIASGEDNGDFLATVPAGGAVTLMARLGDLASRPTNLVLQAGENRVQIVMRDSAPLSGKVLAFDDTPLPAVVVQAERVMNAGDGWQPGLLGEFFAIRNLTDFPTVAGPPNHWRIDEQISFPLANGSIAGAQMDQGFYARWTGRIRIAKAGLHTFHLAANDGGRLRIDGQVRVDSIALLTGSTPLSASENSAEMELAAGDHHVRIDYFNRIGREGCQLYWTPPGRAKEIV